MWSSGAALMRSLAVVLTVTALAGPRGFGAEDQPQAANHPPGFVRPIPDEVIPLWPGDAPHLVPGGRAETVTNERYTNVSAPQLFAYLPPPDKASGTALIICAGGGYSRLAMCLHVENIVPLLHDQGIAVFGLKYRTRYGANDVIQDALADGQRAVRIVRSRAAEWGLDPQRIGVQGYSAGGNLCLNLASRYDGGNPAAEDPLERLSSRPDFVVLMCPWPYTQELDDFPFDRQAPPTFVASARDDTTAPNSFAVAIADKLRGLGVATHTFLPETGGHGAFHCGLVEGPGTDWPNVLFPWLRQIGMLPARAPAQGTGPEPAPASWRVGVARRDITPEGPIWMAGYASRNHPSEGTVHPLWAKALAVEDAEGQRAVIVTTDLIGLVRAVSDPVCERVQQSLGLPRQRVLLNSSHTHCGPVVRKCAEVAYGLDARQSEIVASYGQQLEDHLVAVIEEACGAMQPATLAYGEGEATFAINRRMPVDGGYQIGENPQGPVDHTVPVLAARAEDGRLLAVLFGYACHNTTTAIYQLNGDYAGFAQLALEQQHPGATALFMIGCGADSNPAPRGELALAQQHGQALGQSVDSVLAQPMRPVRSRLRTAFARVELPLVDPPSREALLQRAAAGDVYQQRLAQLLIQRYDAEGALPGSYPFPVQVMRFGSEFSLIGLAGETLVDYAIRLRNELAGERLWVAGYCNEVFAYVPSERVLQEGGYEAGDAMVYFGIHGPFRPGLEDRIVGLVKQLLDQCAAGNP